MFRRELGQLIYALFVGCTFIGRDRSLECSTLADFYDVQEEPDANKILIEGKNVYDVLKKDSFIKYPNLEEILISGSVNEIELGAFEGLKNLRSLGLHENNVTVIKENVFQNLEIGHLYFWNSNVHEIEIGAFNNIRKIHEIWLDTNYLTVIKKGVFTDKPFDIIHIPDNQLLYIEPGAFSGMETLIELDLGINLLGSFEARMIGLGGSLKKLFLEYNKLTTLTETSFAGLTNLRVLNLTTNLISSISEHTFGSNLEHLQILDLSNNNLIELNPNAFHTESPISSLFLQTNNLTYISLEVLEHLPKLQNISTVYNPWQCSCQTDFKNKLTEKNITSLCENSEENSMCFKETSKCVFEVGKSIIINKKHEVDKNQICVTEYWRNYVH